MSQGGNTTTNTNCLASKWSETSYAAMFCLICKLIPNGIEEQAGKFMTWDILKKMVYEF